MLLPNPKGIWYNIGTTVLQTPPTTSIHITKDVIIVPPLAIANKNLNIRKAINQGDIAESMPQKDCKKIETNRTFLRPNLSAATPKNILPVKSKQFIYFFFLSFL